MTLADIGVIALALERVARAVQEFQHNKKNGGSDSGSQTKEYWILEISRIVQERMDSFAKDRDLHIREAVRQELRDWKAGR